jgi:hypothetical protein
MPIECPSSASSDLQAVFQPGELLESFDFQSIENDGAVIYALDCDLHLVYCNAAWDAFAVSNGAPGLIRERQIGMPIMAVIPAPLREFYRRAFGNVLYTRAPWRFTYECSSPRAERHFHMIVNSTWRGDGLIVVNSLISETPHNRPEATGGAQYRNLSGIIIMCAHCRRVRTCREPARWDWVPDYVERMPRDITNSLCPTCKELHYGRDLRG